MLTNLAPTTCLQFTDVTPQGLCQLVVVSLLLWVAIPISVGVSCYTITPNLTVSVAVSDCLSFTELIGLYSFQLGISAQAMSSYWQGDSNPHFLSVAVLPYLNVIHPRAIHYGSFPPGVLPILDDTSTLLSIQFFLLLQ